MFKRFWPVVVCAAILAVVLGVGIAYPAPTPYDDGPLWTAVAEPREATLTDEALSFSVTSDPTSNVPCYMVQGGEGWVADDGCTWGMLSGATLEVQAGAVVTFPSATFDYIDFSTTATDPDYFQGRMFWDTEDETIAVHVNNGADQVTLQVGQEQHVLVRNDTGSDWLNGSVHIANGSVGYRPTAILAKADVITTSGAQCMATQAITKNTSGVVTTFGMVRGIDTHSWSEGDLLYVSATDAGVLTNVPPTSGYNVIFGRVLRSHPTDGIVFVNPREAPYRGNLAGGDYVDWDYRGQMTAYGDARWWDDIRVPAQNTRVNPVTSKPDFGTFIGGTRTFLFDPGDEESVNFSVQMPHSWAFETAIEPHVHWTPTNTNGGVVIWGLECTTGAISTTFGSTATSTVGQTANGTAYYHHYADFGEMSMTGIDSVSAMLVCRLFRDADATGDTYNADAALLEIDFHFLSDTLGSPEEKDK